MKKMVINRGCIESALLKAKITEEFLEVECTTDLVVIRPKKLQCVSCGCKNEKKLIKMNGVHLCTKCIGEFSEFIDKTESMEDDEYDY